MKRLVWAMAGVVLLGACSSGVPLTEPPSEDKLGVAVRMASFMAMVAGSVSRLSATW